jgi:hypothetical protein
MVKIERFAALEAHCDLLWPADENIHSKLASPEHSTDFSAHKTLVFIAIVNNKKVEAAPTTLGVNLRAARRGSSWIKVVMVGL